MNESSTLTRYELALGYRQIIESDEYRVELEDMQSGEFHVNIITDKARGHVFCDTLTAARRAYSRLHTALRQDKNPLDLLPRLDYLGNTHIHNY